MKPRRRGLVGGKLGDQRLQWSRGDEATETACVEDGIDHIGPSMEPWR